MKKAIAWARSCGLLLAGIQAVIVTMGAMVPQVRAFAADIVEDAPAVRETLDAIRAQNKSMMQLMLILHKDEIPDAIATDMLREPPETVRGNNGSDVR